MKKRVPNKHAMYTCHHCGGFIYNDERSKVTSSIKGIHHYHYDHGLDCLAAHEDQKHHQEEFNFDHVAERGYE